MKRYSILGPNQILAVQKLIGQLNGKVRWSIEISRDDPNHTKAQSRLWHAMLDAAADAAGVNREEFKEAAYLAFGPTKTVEVNGFEFRVCKARKQWTIEEASDFTEKLSAWTASEYGVML